MWIFCCGMRRSGSTLQYQIATDIVESAGVGQGLGWIATNKFPELFTKHLDNEQFFVVKTHDFIPHAIILDIEKKAKCIYIYRDIRDVVVSTMKKGNIPFLRVATSGFIADVLNEYHLWTGLENILISQYESVVEDVSLEVGRVANHLEIILEQTQINAIAEKYKLARQTERIQHLNNCTKPGVIHMYDPQSLLHHNHINSGDVAQWKTQLSPIQNGIIESLAYNWLISHSYQISQGWVNKTESFLIEKSFSLATKAKNLTSIRRK